MKMVNPFDEVVKIDNTKQKDIVYDNKSKVNNDEHIKVSISLNKRIIERGIFIVIIIILGLLVIVNPFSNCKIDGIDNISGNAVAEQNQENTQEQLSPTVENDAGNEEIDQEPTVQTQSEPVAPAETTVTTSTTKTKEEDIKGDITKPFRNNFDFIIDEVDYERNDDGNPSKIKTITFTMRNRWVDFKPRVEAYWYDKDSNEIIQAKKRSVMILTEIEVGKIQKYTIRDFDSTYFDPQNPKETIELKLYNQDTGLLMTTVTKEIS